MGLWNLPTSMAKECEPTRSLVNATRYEVFSHLRVRLQVKQPVGSEFISTVASYTVIPQEVAIPSLYELISVYTH